MIKNTLIDWCQQYKECMESEKLSPILVDMADSEQKDEELDVLTLGLALPLAYALMQKGKISENNKLGLVIQTDDHATVGAVNEMFSNVMDVPYISARTRRSASGSDEIVLKHIDEVKNYKRIMPIFEVKRDDDVKDGIMPCDLLREQFERAGSNAGIRPFLNVVERFRNELESQNPLLLQHVKSDMEKMSVLVAAVWYMLLIAAVDSGQLGSRTDAKDPGYFERYENELSKTRMDAIGYAEAMYQLIENACLHSDGHRAWFCLRTTYAGSKKNSKRSVDPRNIAKRRRLSDKYAIPAMFLGNDIFKENEVETYLEFMVIDSAFFGNGLVSNFNKTSGRPEIDEIDALFHLKARGDNLEYYIEDHTVHYGLRLLKRMLSVNNGYMICISPGKEKGESCFGVGQQEITEYFERKYEDDATERYDSFKKKVDEIYPQNPFFTLWNLILPVEFCWRRHEDESPAGDSHISQSLDRPRDRICYLKDIKTDSWDKEQKPENVRKIREEILGHWNAPYEDSVLVLQVPDRERNIELYAKAIFSLLAQLTGAGQKELTAPILIALLFPNVRCMHEFLRFYSILYIDGEAQIMSKAQIALCIDAKENAPYRIEVVLAKQYLTDAASVAKWYSYHNPAVSLRHMPILRYLTDPGGKRQIMDLDAEKEILLYPFDMILPESFEDLINGSTELEYRPENSWFHAGIMRTLSRPMDSSDMGCMVDAIHIRLGSKVHMDRFYEGELLFHDSGNITRFALQIVWNLLYGNPAEERIPSNEKLILVGYEEYSVCLMLEIREMLQRSHRCDDIEIMIVKNEDEREDTRLICLFDEEGYDYKGVTKLITVVPIGTTLSTFYKIHNVITRRIKRYDASFSKAKFAHNYCLILVAPEEGNGSEDAVSRYYKKRNRKDIYSIDLGKDTQEQEKEVNVIALFRTPAHMYDPKDCRLCSLEENRIRPILDVKNAEMLPAAIFPMKEERSGSFRSFFGEDPKKGLQTNKERLDGLLHHVTYSHIRKRNDHFQFLIDFDAFFEENEKSIVDYLRGIRIADNAFHMVISPLQLTNSKYIKAVLEHVFHGCARFLHFDIMDSYREEIRSKFSYVSKEYRMLKERRPDAELQIHFVDNSIISGSQINRTMVLIQMLLTQSGIRDADAYFSHVFLLVNRSSYDTIRAYVKRPASDLHAYIHLAIPSYNTENNACPACSLGAKYQRLQKRSSTEAVSKEFFRLREKHEVRSREEHERVIRTDILDHSAYFGWLRYWLLIQVVESGEDTVILSNIGTDYGERPANEEDIRLAKKLKESLHDYFLQKLENVSSDDKDAEQNILKIVSDMKLRDYIAFLAKQQSEDQEKLEIGTVRLIERYMIDERDFMRLYAMQEGYEELLKQDAGDAEDENKVQPRILKLISGKLQKIPKKDSTELLPLQRKMHIFYRNTEWLLSYCKVLSRPHMVNYYPIRSGIVNILYHIYLLMVCDKSGFDQKAKELSNTDNSWKEITAALRAMLYSAEKDPAMRRVCAYLRYQIFVMLIHRLSDLQISRIISQHEIENYSRIYKECVEACFKIPSTGDDRWIMIESINLPDDEGAVVRYLKSVKSATMASDDDSPCLRLADLTRSELFSGKGYLEDNIYQMIFLENTRMLYSAMNDLESEILDGSEDRSKGHDTGFSTYIEEMKKFVGKRLRECYNYSSEVYNRDDILYQNRLSGFCQFWHNSYGQAPVLPEGKGEGDKDLIACMFQYYSRLKDLTDDDKKSKRHHSELPYLYEDICRCLCAISGYGMCYLVYSEGFGMPVIVSQSGYRQDYLICDRILSPLEISNIISGKKGDGKTRDYIIKKSAWKASYLYSDDTKAEEYLVLNFSLQNGTGRSCYIVLQTAYLPKDWEKGYRRKLDFHLIRDQGIDSDFLKTIRNIIFMRQTFIEAFARDYSVLLNMRYDCSYIRDRGGKDKKILHLSDLHIPSEIEKLKDMAEELCKKADNTELVILTGDVADSRSASAPIMEKRYQNAAKLFQYMACRLWADKEGYLPHDWKKRFVHCTGNHDYALMNQYRVETKRRNLVPGSPIEAESSTMAKFSYYVNYLMKYFDAPVDALLRNDLNEVRDYKNLHIKICILNCTGLATPQRTNKIGVNTKAALDLVRTNMWRTESNIAGYDEDKIFRICIGHYSPSYELSYFVDKFQDSIPGWSWEDEKGAVNVFIKEDFAAAVLSEYQKWAKYCVDLEENGKKDTDLSKETGAFISKCDSLRNAMEEFENGRSDMDGGDAISDFIRSFVLDCKDKDRKEYIRRLKENSLYQRVENFYYWVLEEGSYPEYRNEQIIDLLNDVKNCLTMGNEDLRNYQVLINEVHETEHIDLFLSGHIHAFKEGEYDPNKNGETSIPKIKELTAGKCLNLEKEELSGWLIGEIEKDSSGEKFSSRKITGGKAGKEKP